MSAFYPHGSVGIALLVLTIILAVILVALLVVCGLLCKYGYFSNPFSHEPPYRIVEKEDYLVVETVKKKIQPIGNDRVDMHVYPAKLDDLVKTTKDNELQMFPIDDDMESVASSTQGILRAHHVRNPRPDSGVPYAGLGCVVFQLRYSAPNEQLRVHLLHGRQISQRNGELAAWPLIRICLNHDILQEQQTSPDESPNPEYDQDFIFPLPESKLGQSVVLLTVWDTDTHEQKTLIGYVRVALANFLESLDGPEGTGPLRREIAEDSEEARDPFFGGQLMLSLTYSPTLDRMIVAVLRGVNIHETENSTVLYAKVFLTLSSDIVYSKKTSTVKNSSNPVFHSNILLDQLTDNGASDIGHLGLIVSLRAKTSDRKKIIIGQVALGNFPHAREDGVMHWKEAIQSPNFSVAQWHKLRMKQ